VVKDQAGSDSSIDFGRFEPDDLRQKIEDLSPNILAFNGKKAAQVFLGERRVKYRLQGTQIGETRLFVAPSTSGAANRYRSTEPWYELSKMALENTT